MQAHGVPWPLRARPGPGMQGRTVILTEHVLWGSSAPTSPLHIQAPVQAEGRPWIGEELGLGLGLGPEGTNGNSEMRVGLGSAHQGAPEHSRLPPPIPFHFSQLKQWAQDSYLRARASQRPPEDGFPSPCPAGWGE